MVQDSFDVAVIGAGPAGSVAAFAAARRGLRVALVDRSLFPRDKTCGDGIGPGAVEVVHRLGLDTVFDGCAPVRAVTIFGPRGERLDSAIARGDGHAAFGHVIARLDLDGRLVREAFRAGAADFTGMRFKSMHVTPDARLVEVRAADGTEHTISARLVVGADGAYSPVRKALTAGTDDNGAKKKHLSLAMRAYAESEDFRPGGAFGPRLLFEFGRDLLPNYAWLFPLDDGRVNLGVGGPLEVLQRRGDDLKVLMAMFADKLRDRGIALGELHDQRAHHLPHIGGLPKLTYPRAVLIGDAASMINPVSGEGIAYAVTAAEQLVSTLPSSLNEAAQLAAALARFESDFRRRYRAHFVSSRVSLRMLRSQRWASMLLRAAQRDPQMLQDGVELLFGFGRIRASTVLRVLRSGLI
ncbi:MAG TPA: geranylgeranyl reductase family protein [Actinocrinis sp.]|jgi:geranylgeranyl reductase family protein